MTDTVTISREDYHRLLNAQQDIDDSRYISRAMVEIAAGAPVFTRAESDEYLAAVTPLAFWRKRAGKTQAILAADIGVSQAFLAQLEGGRREGSIGVLVKLARALSVRVDDLINV